MSRRLVAITIRIPERMHQAAKKYAALERRSLNNQILIWFERGIPLGILDEGSDAMREADR